jgi:hypothetical protein
MPKEKPSAGFWNLQGEMLRIVLCPSEWKKLRVWVWETYLYVYGTVDCHLCERPIREFEDYELDHHPIPRGMGGGTRDDRHVKPSHFSCNRAKGSKRL